MELVKDRRTVLELSQEMFSAVTFHEMYRIDAQAALDEAGRALSERNRVVRNKKNDLKVHYSRDTSQKNVYIDEDSAQAQLFLQLCQ
jgi:hypothetical protein